MVSPLKNDSVNGSRIFDVLHVEIATEYLDARVYLKGIQFSTFDPCYANLLC